MPVAPSSSAESFHRLHAEGLLILPNAWDAGSARLIETAGASAIATSSAAVAWSHGYRDGDVLPVKILAATVAEIARAIRIPLSVDAESGYATDPAAVGEVVTALVSAGAVGINLEDGNDHPDVLCAKIGHAKRAALRLGVNLFVNARTDVYLRDLVPDARKVEETIVRAARYRASGADGFFPAGLTQPADIKLVTSTVKMPVNLLVRPTLPRASELIALGVRRLSAGSSLASMISGRVSRAAREFLRDGMYNPMADGPIAYPDMNALFPSKD